MVDFGALALAAWMVSLTALTMTASSQRRGERTLLERFLWRWAYHRSRKRRADLVRKIRDSDLATRPERNTLDYLQREDILFHASGRAFAIKVITTSVLSFNAGGALFAVAMASDQHSWRHSLAGGLLAGPVFITIGLNVLAMGPGMQRWTTEIVTATARRTYEALLVSFETPGPELRSKQPFHSPHVPAVRAMDDFARALERYAVQRALPDGRNPMPQVVARYAAAAAHVRKLRDSVELDRADGRKHALLEVERMLKVLAGARPQDLAPVEDDADNFLSSHHERRAWRRRTLGLVIFTLTLGGVVAALVVSASALGAAVATVVATFVVASWGKNLGLSSGPGGER